LFVDKLKGEDMNIYRLWRIGVPNYDEKVCSVVIAENEGQARVLANTHTGDEGPIWGHKERVRCEIVDASISRVLLEEFNWG
jgi:hypothetical protein